jgi:hypothetical protein
MSKEDKPLEYQRRIRDTKGVAQRLDLGYLNRASLLALFRKRLAWGLVAAAALVAAPLVMGVGESRKKLENGPLSDAHAIFERRCEACHSESFARVADKACMQCHDGAPHPAKSVDRAHANAQVRCAECHLEHRGKVRLAAVANADCTSCHANLEAHATGVTIKGKEITAFRESKHPEFSTVGMKDPRPIKLNHAAHMPAEAKVIRGIKLPMKCGDCHVVEHASPDGALLPVTFEANCKNCHARELEFDVDHVLGDRSVPAPHAKDAKAIREFIWRQYEGALKADPSLARRPVGNDLAAQPNLTSWMNRVVDDAVGYLFGRKCVYCHVTAGGGEVSKVNRISGRFVEGKPEGEPWLARGEFAHRSHRAVECESCHTQAQTSRSTADVLIPAMKSCTPCHGDSGTSLDDCAKCHQYHNRMLEKDRSPSEQMRSLVGAARAWRPAAL